MNDVIGLENLNNDVRDTLGIYFKLFILLYADDTVLISETEEGLQTSLNIFSEYCKTWKLKVNAEKTKVVVFSKGRQTNYNFKYDSHDVEVVDEFLYLGVIFNRKGGFASTIKRNAQKGLKAVYEILKKGRLHKLSVSCQYDLYCSIVKPILLYGCEVWGTGNYECLERVHLKFCKLLLNLKRSTPSYMVYGELGAYPLYVDVQSRILNYWCKVAFAGDNKFSNIMYAFYKCKFTQDFSNSKWMLYVKNSLNNLGFGNMWDSNEGFTYEWFKHTIKQRIYDQFEQKWHCNVFDSPKGHFYRIIKENFCFEKYLDILDPSDRIALCRFRTCNNRLPIEVGRWYGIERSERKCTLCNDNEIGDEYHYLFRCSSFSVIRYQCINWRKKSLPNVLTTKFMFTSHNIVTLRKLSKFAKAIYHALSSL